MKISHGVMIFPYRCAPLETVCVPQHMEKLRKSQDGNYVVPVARFIRCTSNLFTSFAAGPCPLHSDVTCRTNAIYL